MTPTLSDIYCFISIATLTKIISACTENTPHSINGRNFINATYIKQLRAQNIMSMRVR